jgi:hypothetical protein
MKQSPGFLRTVPFIFVLIAASLTATCGDIQFPTPSVRIEDVGETMTMTVGETRLLRALVGTRPGGSVDIRWQSSDPSVVSIEDQGFGPNFGMTPAINVTALSVGVAVIEVSALCRAPDLCPKGLDRAEVTVTQP